MHAVVATVGGFLAEHDVTGTIVAGVSGGADSTALLHGLVAAGAGVHAAHLDHGMREAADDDARFVAALANDLGVPVTIGATDVPAEHAARTGGSLEDTARRARHRFLRKVAAEQGAPWIALGHTMDDQAETVLLNVVRGSGVRGLAGMRPVRDAVLRPLLTLRRAAVLDYLTSLGAAYRDDPSNLDMAYTRNRVRHELVPLLTAYNPQVTEALGRTAFVAGLAADWIDDEVAALIHRAARRDGDALMVDGAAIEEAPRFLALAALRELVGEVAGGVGGVSLAHVEAVAALTAGAAVTLPAGVVVRRSAEGLVLGRPASPAQWEVDAALPGLTMLPAAGVTLDLAHTPPPDDLATGPGEAYMDAAGISPPLVVRSRRPGDRFHPLGAPGSQKLKQYLADHKIPAGERDRVPLLVDRDGIVCVLGSRIAERVRVGPATERCVHAVLRPLG